MTELVTRIIVGSTSLALGGLIGWHVTGIIGGLILAAMR
jgi:hypothetical protein